MKNKIIVYPLLAIMLLFTLLSKSYGLKKSIITNDDEIKKILELNTATNPLTAKLSVYRFDIFNDTLYVINKTYFVKISLKTGKIFTNLKINAFLGNKFKSHIGASNIRVCNAGYYISCLNELYFIDYFGKVDRIFENNGRLINDFNIVGDKIILASRGNMIKLIGKNGNVISTSSAEIADNWNICSYSGLCYDGISNIYEWQVDENDQIITKKYASIYLNKEIKDPSIAYNSEKYFIEFSYYQRDKLYIFNKSSEKNQLIKQISLDQSYFNKKAIPDEGQPDFRVIAREGVDYLVTVSNKKLNVFTFNF